MIRIKIIIDHERGLEDDCGDEVREKRPETEEFHSVQMLAVVVVNERFDKFAVQC